MSKNYVKFFCLVGCIFAFSMGISAEDASPNKEEEKWYDTLKLSGMIRIRPEIKSNTGFADKAANEYDFIGQKAWISLSANPLKNLKLLITVQDSRLWGGETGSMTGLGTTSPDNLGLREAFFDLGLFEDSQFHIIAGRQKIEYGDQRLFGSLEWNNVGRSFDALKLKWETGNNTLSLWSSALQESNSLDAPQVSAGKGLGDIFYYGLYNTMKLDDLLLADVYYASKINILDSSTLKLHTAGMRLTDKSIKNQTVNNFPVDYTLEGAYQFGTRSSKTISAYAAALALGYTFGSDMKIRFGVEGDIASGDTDSTDKKFETFDNLFPTNHGHYGQADMMSWQNMLGGSANIGIAFSKKLSAVVSYWYLSRLVAADNWYTVAGGFLTSNQGWITGTSGASKSLFLGHEIDITVKTEISSHFLFEGGYSIVLPGTAPTDAGHNAPYHFAYVSAMAKF
ncbi:MAG: alginate export family protein [Spirochaetia bacterium]|nr:alginate export family protein [Spirochaetia bacterium]